MKFHDKLNPKLWNNFELKEEVKDKLEEITEAFIDYLEIPREAILDVRMTGSSANFNYTKYSDIDLHLIIDYEKVHEDCPLVDGYLWSKKAIFNNEHDISIYNIPVEVYCEDSNQEAISNGVYSLLNDEWIKKPEKIEPTTNDVAVESKFNELKEAIDKTDDSEEAEKLLSKIYEMRKAGLQEVGELSTENLAFKKLRDAGMLERLKAMKKEKIDKELSLESKNESIKEEFNIGDKVWRRNPETQDRMIGEVIDKSYKDGQEYLTVKFHWWSSHDGTYPADFFQKLDKNESIKEYYEEDDCEDIPEEMHKERYVTYFETPEGRQKYTIYHVYTDSTDDSYNELCDKRDNQLGMYNSYKELKDALKERAEKIATKQGWTVKSIQNLGEDDEYYRERNKWESINNRNYMDRLVGSTVKLRNLNKIIESYL